jgi:acetyltransferase-like isoleucine patch superfamily enzyme
MKFQETYIESYVNTTGETVHLDGLLRLNAGACIYRSKVNGPLFLDCNAQLGPETTIGKYCSLGRDTYVARSTIGSFCPTGARVAINPFNHPRDWLSTHEFQYRGDSYGWVAEYRDLARLERSADMFTTVMIGSDVWTGHNACIMGGVRIGHGAIVAAGSVVTADVPAYAVVAGVPATVKRLRFGEKIIERLLRARWWEFELSHLSGLPFRDVERCLDRIEEIRAAKFSHKEPAGQ